MNPLDRLHPLDQWTRNADRALGHLFLKAPVRTSLGLALGGTLSFLSALFEPALRDITVADFSGMPWWSWFAPGIVIMPFPTIVQLLKKPSVGNHTLDELLEFIDRAGYGAAERRQLCRRVVDGYVQILAADSTVRKEHSALTKSALD